MADATGIPGSLPTPFTSFVGRRTEVAGVRSLLGASRLVTLTGAGGVGKTRLALEVAAGSGRAFPGGVRLVDLAPVRESSAVPGVVADALGVADVGTRPVVELLVAHLSGRRVLVVLDNCEHLVDACALLVQRLLSVAPELRILATSWETLRVTGEHVFAVAPLPQADARPRCAAVGRCGLPRRRRSRPQARRRGVRIAASPPEPVEYGAAVDRCLAAADLGSASRRVYRNSLHGRPGRWSTAGLRPVMSARAHIRPSFLLPCSRPDHYTPGDRPDSVNAVSWTGT
ncbi:ATP-binding protein [Streptomyces cellostaticus]|uniref:ATP-binding protein n=1 Tax=Streptomyces cellostaticus TaxID=67285 RepID=UPI00131CC449|nr:hypothetical protein [Streptomyces cellostaticus]